MSQSKITRAKFAMAAILGATIFIGCNEKSDDSASQTATPAPSKPNADMSNLTASTPAAPPQSLPPALPPALPLAATPAATPAVTPPALAADPITAPPAAASATSMPAVAAAPAMPAAANPPVPTTQASGPQEQLAQLTQLIAANKLDLADAAIAKLDAIRPSLSPPLQTELDAAHTALAGAKAMGALALPGLLTPSQPSPPQSNPPK